jgi:hypothetical protein
MFLDEQVTLFVYRKLLKVLFKLKDKLSYPEDISLIESLIKEIKIEMNEIFIVVKTRKKEK